MVKNATVARHSCSEINFGEKLRQSRKDTSMTMQQVADRAGLSVGFISQVERGITSPSLSSLRSIAEVLGQPISYFLDQPTNIGNTVRSSQRVNYQVAEGVLSYERLSAKFPGSFIKSVIIHEPPGYRSEAISHEGEELFYVLEGELTFKIEGVSNILYQGDSVHFDSRRVHSTWNHTTETTTLLWCGTMDIFGEDAIEKISREEGLKQSVKQKEK